MPRRSKPRDIDAIQAEEETVLAPVDEDDPDEYLKAAAALLMDVDAVGTKKSADGEADAEADADAEAEADGDDDDESSDDGEDGDEEFDGGDDDDEDSEEEILLTGRDQYVMQETNVRPLLVVRKGRHTRAVMNRFEYASVVSARTEMIEKTGATMLSEEEEAALPVVDFAFLAACAEVRQGIAPLILRRDVGYYNGARVCEDFRLDEVVRPFAK